MELRDGLAGTVVDMHVHTMGASSDSMLKPDDLGTILPTNGLNGVNIAEHDQVWDPHVRQEYRARHPHIFVNFGMEVSTDLGHMIAIGLNAYIGGIRRAKELRAELDRVGGFLIVAHPFRHVFDPVTAMRRGNTRFDLSPEQAAELPVFSLVDGIEVANACNTPRENYFAAEVARVVGKPGTGGSDAHSNTGIGYFSTGFEREIHTPEQFLEELHAARFQAVHRTRAGRIVRFEDGSIEAAEQANAEQQAAGAGSSA